MTFFEAVMYRRRQEKQRREYTASMVHKYRIVVCDVCDGALKFKGKKQGRCEYCFGGELRGRIIKV